MNHAAKTLEQVKHGGRRLRRKPVIALALAGLLSGTAATTLPMLQPFDTAAAETLFNRAPAEGFADLVETVMPAVISIEVNHKLVSNRLPDGMADQFTMPDLGPDNPFREFFEQFRGRGFGVPSPSPAPNSRAQGSGFIISADGYAVTNNHVVANAEQVTISLPDGTQYEAEVVGTDPKTDLALLKIDADHKLRYVEFADDEPRVGDWVIAVGNPFGLGGSVTTGIISARERNIGSGPYDDFLQIDAPINKGNSGGPAFNLEGKVVGVNTAIFSPSGGSVGIGFAIPASIAKQVIGEIRDKGQVTRGWLGVQIQPVTEDIAESLGLDAAQGAIVADVTQDSPALEAGIKTGDTILEVNGEAIEDPRHLARKVATLAPGETAEVLVYRDGKREKVSVAIGTMPGDQELAARSGSDAPETDRTRLGLELVPSEDGRGVQVASVMPNSPAAEKGLRPGDVILEVGGIQVDDPIAVEAAFERAAGNGQKGVLMLVRSGERQRFVAMPTASS
ncbi:MAG TPA: Do family serine endopeptidase [Hyphomicrobiales bacterium]|nr:Do family serine endopeptidase [Hyphomicrobiales bacterium]